MLGVFLAKAQQKGLYLTIDGGLGANHFCYTLNSGNKSVPQLGWGGNLGVQYFFTKHWGLGTGIGISFYNSKGNYSNSWQNDLSHYSFNGMHDDDLGTLDDNYKYYTLLLGLSNWTEIQKGYFLEVPLMLRYQTKWGASEKVGIYFGVGLKMQVPIISQKYKVQNGSQLSVSAYYDAPDMTLPDPHGPDVSDHGYGTNSNISYSGTMNLKLGLAATGEVGFLFMLSRRVDLTLGAYLDYDFINMKKNNKTAEGYLICPENGATTIQPSSYVGDRLQYHGYLNSYTTDKVNLLGVGGKVGLRIKLGKLHKQSSEIESNNIPNDIPIPTVKCCDSLKVDLNTDSIDRQLQRILLLLENVPAKQEVEKTQVIQGVVKDAKTDIPLSALVELTDTKTDKISATFHTDSIDGKYRFDLPSEGSYTIDVKKEGYLYYSENFIVPESDNSQIINQTIPLNELVVDQVIILENIFFDTDKTTLKPESMKEIEYVYHLMIDNPTMEIELSGHTDNVGNAAYNKNLSLKRANVVKEILVNKGVPTNRITTAGYGFDKPISTNNTAEGRAENRRTEFKILKM